MLVEDRLQIRRDDVGLVEDEPRIVGQVLDVRGSPRREVIQADDAVTLAQ
jgi:hypothetical protein